MQDAQWMYTTEAIDIKLSRVGKELRAYQNGVRRQNSKESIKYLINIGIAILALVISIISIVIQIVE